MYVQMNIKWDKYCKSIAHNVNKKNLVVKLYPSYF